MSALIERLRNPAWIHTHVSVNARAELDEDQAVDDMKDAAAEIERLLSACKDKTELLVAAYSQIERLRAAIALTIEESRHLADGDNSTLRHLLALNIHNQTGERS